MKNPFAFEVEPFETYSTTESAPIEFSWETSKSDFEMGAASHPTLGPGRRVSRQGEFEEQETSMTVFHPLLGPGRRIRRTAEIESELEIIGADERKRVDNTTGVPFRWLCSLDLLFPDPDDPASYLAFVGSGTLISPRHILQWRSYGQVTNANPAAGPQLIYYDLDTCGGHSGSPVWLRWKEYRTLVAIHTGPCILGADCQAVAGLPCFPGGQRYSANRGVLITTAVLDDVKQWMA